MGLLFAYGFAGYIINELGSWIGGSPLGSLITPSLILWGTGFFPYMSTMIFALIGFGCLFALISRSTLSGFFTSFFIVGFTTIFSPVLQKFWYNVFSSTFSANQPLYNTDTSGSGDYHHYLSSLTVHISFFDMRISLLNAISQLVVFYGVYQKLNVAQTFLLSIFFQILWTLNFALNVHVTFTQPDFNRRLMDDYAINQVFMFGSLFGLIVSFINKRPPRDDYSLGVGLPRHMQNYSQARGSEAPLIVSLLGTFLLFLTFMGITICYPIKAIRNRYYWPEGFCNIIFALCASVFTTMFLGIIIRGRIPLK